MLGGRAGFGVVTLGARFTATTTDAGGATGERPVAPSTRRASEDGAGTHAHVAARRPSRASRSRIACTACAGEVRRVTSTLAIVSARVGSSKLSTVTPRMLVFGPGPPLSLGTGLGMESW